MHAVPLLSVALASLFASRAAAGATCYALRPTEPGAERTYAGAPATVFDTPEGNVRVWYALEGPHAPESAGVAQTPSGVQAAGAAAEAALTRFADLGFRLPLPDGPGSPCSDTGGDARVDVYLYDFTSADGTIVIDQCAELGTERCAGFAVVENDFRNKGYASPTEGFQTVVPHELFHLVQYAYSTTNETWWAEGTAQWAAKNVYPELRDLEGFLPAFFQRTDRPLDFPPVGAAASFSYGAAIWPVFLTEKFDAPVVRGVFEALGERAPSALEAVEFTLQSEGASLDGAFTEFAGWNLATGVRSGSLGYASAASYPEITLEELPVAVPSKAVGALAGLSARYFHFPGGERRHLEVSADVERLSARFVPLVEAEARIGEAMGLPVETSGAGILVLSGRARDHRDVAFTIRIEEALEPPADESDGGASGNGSAGAAGANDALGRGGTDDVSQGEGGIGEVSVPTTPADGGTPTVAEVATNERARASEGCSTVPAPLVPPPTSTIVAALGLGVGLGRLLARIGRRRASSKKSDLLDTKSQDFRDITRRSV